MDPNFRKLSVEHIVSAYKRTKNRAILLYYDCTLLLTGSLNVIPNVEAVGILNNLYRDPKNDVFLPKHDAYWETCVSVPDFDWKQIVEPMIKLYTETMNGSTIETKDSSLVWNYQHIDPDFGICHAKELLDHLENILANKPISGVNKGLVVEHLLTTMQQRGMLSDFVLSIEDDRSDEDMFKVIMQATVEPYISPIVDVFACTVGQKCSKANTTWKTELRF
ncbi:hypothetical protein V6N13_138330 [Hibiscus sabdariffa]